MFQVQLKLLRENQGLSQQELADRLGIRQSTVGMWENGTNKPRNSTLVKIADYFGVSVDYLLGNTSKPTPHRTGIQVPVLGCVAAGIPIEAIEEVIDYEELDPKEFNPNYEYFGLKIKGDSMTPRIQHNDVVIVRCQADVDSGDIAIVCINGQDATCKQIKKHENGISLIPFNSTYDVTFFTTSEIESLPVTIIGKVVELRAKF